MEKRASKNLYEVVMSEEELLKTEKSAPSAEFLELLLSELPNDELAPLFQLVFKFVHKNYKCDLAFCSSINTEMKNKIIESGQSLGKKEYYFRMFWSNNSDLERRYRDDIGPILTVSKEAQTLCLKNADRYFFRFFIGEKEGQEYYFIFSNKLTENVPTTFISQLKIFLKSRFSLYCDLEALGKFKALVYVDDVTGLYNQRKLIKDLEHSAKKFEDSGIPFAVLFIDIDHFKRVNDGHGHLIGTQLLADLAVLLKKILRESDLIYRYGGDEFVMILPQSTPENARGIAERILRAVKKEEFLKSTATPFKLSVSIGIAGVPTHAKAPQELLAMADQMMYTAKSSGRGKVCMAGEIFE